MTTDYRTNSVGTNDWLQATSQMDYQGFYRKGRSLRTLNDSDDCKTEISKLTSGRQFESLTLSFKTPSVRDLENLFVSSSIEWSIHATEDQERILHRLVDSGQEPVAQRLSNLIDILFEDEDKLALGINESGSRVFHRKRAQVSRPCHRER